MEQYASVSNWDETGLVDIVKVKLSGDAAQFLNGREQLADDNVRYDVLKAALVDRFSENLPARQYYNQTPRGYPRQRRVAYAILRQVQGSKFEDSEEKCKPERTTSPK
jgi:hypothetical protein